MLLELVLVSIFGGLIALDKTEVCQTTLSQPLLAGPCVGLLLNDLPGGVLVGILFQLAYLWVMPIGTAAFPDTAVGSVVGSSGFVILRRICPDSPNLIVLVIFLFVIPFSLFAGWSLIKQRQLNSKLLPKADLYADKIAITRFGCLLFLGLSSSFVRGFVVTGSGILCVLIFLRPLVALLSFVPEFYLLNIEIPIWGLGLGTVIYLFGSKENFSWCVLGAFIATILILI